MINFVNLLIFCTLSTGVYYTSTKSNNKAFFIMLALELLSVIFLFTHPVWYDNACSGINIFEILTSNLNVTATQIAEGLIVMIATIILLIVPFCSPFLENTVINKQKGRR